MRASDRAYHALLEEIQTGLLAPGAVLQEVEQSVRLGVSRTPLRAALAQLAIDGLVRQVTPRVTVVTALDVDDIRALHVVRIALEGAAVRLAAERATIAERAEFAHIASEFARARPLETSAIDAYYKLIDRFDCMVDTVTTNPYLISGLATVRKHLVRVRSLARDLPERLLDSAREHSEIASAIASRDGELATHALHVHLNHALRSAIQILTQHTEGTETS